MSSYENLFIILGNQLFENKYFPREIDYQNTIFFMAEDNDLCNHFQYHKHKLIFFLSAMRNYRDEIKKKSYNISYQKIDTKNRHLTYADKLNSFLSKHKSIGKVYIYEIEDKFFEKYIKDYFIERSIELIIIRSPLFLSTRQDFREYLSQVKKPFMANFYQAQRKKFDIMIENGKPVGGKWSFDSDNRNKLPKDIKVPTFPKIKEFDSNTKDVIKLIDKLFQENIGESEDYWIPTKRADAKKYLKNFVQKRLFHFGSYQDSITNSNDMLFHSVISPFINVGLLTPEEVLKEVLNYSSKNEVPLNSVEGFVRQVLGWREFVRGIYQNYSEKQDRLNFFKHKRKLSEKWYTGDLGIPPVDDAIKKVIRLSYNHHIERLMILSNFMLLCQIHPREVHKWFMEMYVDSSDWVMGPNVYGMGQFSDGGIFATKPYISGSNYILKMSDYKKGEWCDIWDGLYWRFIERNKEFYQGNPRMGFVVNTLNKMNEERKNNIYNKAKAFLKDI